MLIAINDFKRGDRPLVPVLNPAQDRLEVVSHRELAQAGVANWNGVRWNGEHASLFPLSETDERKALEKLR